MYFLLWVWSKKWKATALLCTDTGEIFQVPAFLRIAWMRECPLRHVPQLARTHKIDFLARLAVLQPSLNMFKQRWSRQVEDIDACNTIKLVGAGKKACSFLKVIMEKWGNIKLVKLGEDPDWKEGSRCRKSVVWGRGGCRGNIIRILLMCGGRPRWEDIQLN